MPDYLFDLNFQPTAGVAIEWEIIAQIPHSLPILYHKTYISHP